MSSSRGTTTPKTPELDFQRTVLDSGVRVLTTSMPHTGAVSIQILFGAGSRYEPDDLAGSSHLFEHLLFKGTKKRPTPREIAEVIEGVGGVLNAYTDREVTGYWCKVGAPHARNGLDVLIDMFRGPLFREEDVAREKQVVFEEIRATHDSPEGTVDLMLDNTLWPDQPMGRDIAGSIESVESVSTDALKEYLSTQYVASNTVIAVAGAVRHEDVVRDVQEMLGDFGDGEPLQLHPFVDNLQGPSVALQHRGTEQAHLAMGFHGVSNTDPDRYALRLLSTVMGGSMSSRLFEEVREKRGLAYSIHSGVAHFADTGALQISSGVDPQRAEEAVKVVMEELDKMRSGVTDAEFQQARELVKGRLLLRMEESRAVASSAGTQELLLNEVKTVDEIIQEYEAVERDDLARVANRVLNSGKLALSVVGPFDSPDRFRELLTL
ncbi:MAG: M16 family metallopeptidase [Chloroflexota bacterium]